MSAAMRVIGHALSKIESLPDRSGINEAVKVDPSRQLFDHACPRNVSATPAAIMACSNDLRCSQVMVCCQV
jgi:hypothetical protein